MRVASGDLVCDGHSLEFFVAMVVVLLGVWFSLYINIFVGAYAYIIVEVLVKNNYLCVLELCVEL